jgi:hypothetical protein
MLWACFRLSHGARGSACESFYHAIETHRIIIRNLRRMSASREFRLRVFASFLACRAAGRVAHTLPAGAGEGILTCDPAT